MEICRSFLLRMENISDKSVEEIITQILFSYSFRKSSRLRDNVEEHGTARQAANDNIIGAHVLRMLNS
jgi:hypothetical protein